MEVYFEWFDQACSESFDWLRIDSVELLTMNYVEKHNQQGKKIRTRS